MDDNLNFSESSNEDCLKVYTLGHFEVKLDRKVLSDCSKRSQLLWNSFKYLFTYRNIVVIQENLFDVLWVEKACDDPVKALRNLIYRLRLLLNYKAINKDNESIINYSQGCYSWNKEFDYWTDVDEFEELYKKGKIAQKSDDVINAIEFYKKALTLYKGDYLSEDSFNEWVTPVRNYYHSIYMDILVKLTLLLKKHGRNQDILKICEETLMIQPFEESLHILYIKTLIEVGKIRQAQMQYEYVTSMLYKDRGVKPSPDLRELYHQIKCTDNKIMLNLNSIKKVMMERHTSDGALYCDSDTFISFYKLECRRAARTGQVEFMAVLTISKVRHRAQDNKILKITMGTLIDMLTQDLRKGDVVSKWGEFQILVLIPGTTFEQANMVLDRITNKHKITYKSNDIIIKTLLQPINCPD